MSNNNNSNSSNENINYKNQRFAITWKESSTKTVFIEAETLEDAKDLFNNDEYEEKDVEVVDCTFHGIVDAEEV